jgi:DNA-binding CsgD family transcriptional regulator
VLTENAAATGPLLEREEELALLDALLAKAHDGQGAVAVVEGPAGIGKSRLLDAARERADGCRVLRARGGELERDYPWGVARQLLEASVALAPAEERAELLVGAAVHAGEPLGLPVARSSGNGQAGLPGSDDGGFAAIHGLYWLTVALAEREPLLVIVDDAHWADAPSLRFLGYLGRRIDELPVLLLASQRPHSPGAPSDLAEAVGATVVPILPAPLSEPASTEIVRTTWPAAEDVFCAACHRASGGNPFLLQQLAFHLHATGVEPTAQGARIAESAGPRPVARCLTVLPDEAAELARAVAVLGTDAELRHAAALAGLDAATASRAADTLAAADVLRPERPLEFVHPVLRAAVREDIPPGERSVAHARAARLLADDGAGPDRVAVHLLAVDPDAERWRVDVLRAAADEAVERGAPDAAADFLRRALAEPALPAARPTLLRSLGRAELLAGQDASSTLQEALAVTEDHTERVAIGRELGLALVEAGAYEEATAAICAAIAAAREKGDAELSLRTEADMATLGKFAPATRESTRAWLAQVDPTGLERTEAGRSFLCAMAGEAMMSQPPRAHTAELALRAIRAGLGPLSLTTSGSRFDAAYALIMCDELDAADELLGEAAAQAHARGWLFKFGVASCFRALLELRRGRLAEAESEARAALEAIPEQVWDLLRQTAGFLAEALLERGAYDDAAAALEAVDGWGEIASALPLNTLLWSRARVRFARGDVEDGLADLRELAERERLWRRDSPMCLPWRSEMALAQLATGDPRDAEELAETELRLARRWESPRAIGVAQRGLGLVRDDEALLRDASATLEGSPARLEHARALIDLGACVRRAGRRGDARVALRQGADLAQRCGATVLVDRAMGELRAAGARPRRLVLTGVDALTPSERRVSEMAATGMTNREIAQALFVTQRTVEVHLTHAYGKLEIASRAELPAALAR